MNRRKFIQYLGCGCGGLLLNSCASVPITDRKQLRIIPESKLNAQASQIYEKIKEKEKLVTKGNDLKMIKDIGKKMEDSIGEYFYQSNLKDPTVNFQWEYILIDNKKIKNAWCMPGGKIAVYTGILDVTKNKNGLAAIMGHEIAHAVAKHSVERASRGVILNTTIQITDILTGGKVSQVNRTTGMDTVGLLAQLGIMNPFSRKQDSEADYLGLIFSSLSGYDIRETTKIWDRMKEANKGKAPPEFMSTHPSADNRINKIKVKTIFGVYEKERDKLIANSKIVLNMHMYDSKIFEIIRVFYLLTNGITVVSEVGSDTKSNNKYLDSICACEYEQICEKIIYLIENDKERKEIGMKGLDTIKKFPQSLFTKEILDNKI